jgi:hypothetical protein
MYGVYYTALSKELADRLNCHWLLSDINIFFSEARKREQTDYYLVRFRDKGKANSFGRQAEFVITNRNNKVLYRYQYENCDLYARKNICFYISEERDADNKSGFILAYTNDD